MYNFLRNTGTRVYVLCTLAGAPVTGVTSGSVTTYISKNGGSAAAVTLAGWVEVSSGNMPGLYSAQLQSSTLDTDGPVVLSFSGGSFDTYNVLGEVGSADTLLDIRAMAGQIGFRLVPATFDSFGNMLTGELRGYNPGADPSAASPRITLNVVATYDGSGRLTDMQVEEN